MLRRTYYCNGRHTTRSDITRVSMGQFELSHSTPASPSEKASEFPSLVPQIVRGDDLYG